MKSGNTRGVAQFNGTAIDEMLKDESFVNEIDVAKSEAFLNKLLNR